MPTWSPPPDVVLDDALSRAWATLNKLVGESPPFEEVTGIPVYRLQKQAVEAVAAMQVFKDQHDMNDMSAMSFVYILGFTVGTIFGAEHRDTTTQTQAD